MLLLLPLSAHGADIISSSRRTDWSMVGVSNGIPDPSSYSIKTTLSSASTAAEIETALESCVSFEKVMLGRWTNAISGTIDWQGMADYVILEGETNANGTPASGLIFNAGTMYMRRVFDSPNASAVNLTADLTKGSTTITVASVPAWVVVGELYTINELNDSALISNDTDEGAQELETGRGLGHLVKVTAKRGNCWGSLSLKSRSKTRGRYLVAVWSIPTLCRPRHRITRLSHASREDARRLQLRLHHFYCGVDERGFAPSGGLVG